MKTISLSHVASLAGVILQAPSGIAFSNQVGGMACLHPEYEGVFIPLESPLDLSCGDPGSGCWGQELSSEYMAALDERFRFAGLPLRVDFRRIAESTECWVPVRVIQIPHTGINWDGEWDQFAGTSGIYTTSDNCD